MESLANANCYRLSLWVHLGDGDTHMRQRTPTLSWTKDDLSPIGIGDKSAMIFKYMPSFLSRKWYFKTPSVNCWLFFAILSMLHVFLVSDIITNNLSQHLTVCYEMKYASAHNTLLLQNAALETIHIFTLHSYIHVIKNPPRCVQVVFSNPPAAKNGSPPYTLLWLSFTIIELI